MKSKYGRVNLRKIGCKSLVPIHKSFKTPIIHSISTFLILPYTRYTVTSFQILALLPLYGKGGKPVDYVVRLQGNVDYMGTDHLPYAIPAVLIILFLSIPPPLLLISYPLLWKIKAKLRPTEDDTTIWPIRKLLPLIDSFQGVFRDNCRMFAGLLLLWRLVIAAIFAFSAHITDFFLVMTVALFSFFIIHAIARPYKQKVYNIVDIMMLRNMLIINILSWFIYHYLMDHIPTKALIVAVAMKLILMYLPLVSLIAIVIVTLLQEFKKWSFLYNKEEQAATLEGAASSPDVNPTAGADEELFARAAELNNPPLVQGAEFKLQSDESNNSTVLQQDSI